MTSSFQVLLNSSSGSWRKIKKHFTVGHEDVNDLMFTGQRVRWVFDEQKRKKYISIDQKLSVSELEEIIIPKNLKDTDLCDKQLHTSYRSLLGSINWLQSRNTVPGLLQFFQVGIGLSFSKLLVTARSLTSSADRSGTMKLRCVCGL